MRKRRGRKEVHVGLDIGTRLIKGVEVLSEGSTRKLTKLHFVEIDFPLKQENLTTALKSLLENFQPSTKEVNISLSAPSAIVRFINMPKMKDEELKNSLLFEAEKYIPFNIKDVLIDASILEDGVEEKNQMKVLLAAAKKNFVDSRINILKEMGLSIGIIDIDSFACFNAFCNSHDKLDPSKSTGLLNIGYTQTNVVISRGEQPFFTRDIQIGGKDIARAISKQFGVEEKESDKFILEPKDKAGEVYEAAKAVLSKLIDETRLSFGYYENQHGESVDEIYISGGVARLSGILDYFEENFGVKAILWDPFSKFEVGPDIDAKLLELTRSQFAVSAGLAIRK